jgi:hypothetical protein
MKPLELVMKAFDSEAGWDLLDNLTVLRLKESRDLFIKERERLDFVKTVRELKFHEEADWEALVLDIAAINRVLDIYGVYDD